MIRRAFSTLGPGDWRIVGRSRTESKSMLREPRGGRTRRLRSSSGVNSSTPRASQSVSTRGKRSSSRTAVGTSSSHPTSRPLSPLPARLRRARILESSPKKSPQNRFPASRTPPQRRARRARETGARPRVGISNARLQCLSSLSAYRKEVLDTNYEASRSN